AGRQAAHQRARAEDDRRGADLPVAGAERAALPLRAQERRALARHPAADRQELRLRGRRAVAAGREVHARLLPARAGDPPGVAAADRPLPGDPLAPRQRAAPRAPGGARRRPHRARRAAPPGPARRAGLPRGAAAAPQGLLAQPPARLRARGGRGTGHRGLARPDRRRLPGLAGGARSLPRRLREMHELGVLGRYLPEWGALTCLVQYDVYHKFTADQHSLIAVQNLEALAPGQSPDSEGNAQVVSELERPGLLMLGMLLHDIGKGKGHGHVAKGIPLIEALTTRIGLPADDADKVIFL